jgi:transposase
MVKRFVRISGQYPLIEAFQWRKGGSIAQQETAILFDKFHVIRHLGEALDAVRKSEYAWLQGRERRYADGSSFMMAE